MSASWLYMEIPTKCPWLCGESRKVITSLLESGASLSHSKSPSSSSLAYEIPRGSAGDHPDWDRDPTTEDTVTGLWKVKSISTVRDVELHSLEVGASLLLVNRALARRRPAMFAAALTTAMGVHLCVIHGRP